MQIVTARTLAAGVAVAALGFAPGTALARHGADDGPSHSRDDRGGQRDAAAARGGGSRDAVRVPGHCSGSSSAKLKVKPDNRRLETEFEVDQNRNGVRWSVRLRRNGRTVVRTHATTHAPSGSFSVERRIANPAGRDRITARATSPSGEVCRATLRI